MAVSVIGKVLLDTNVFNDLLIALTAWRIGATVVTGNLNEFHCIAAFLPGLSVVPPGGSHLSLANPRR